MTRSKRSHRLPPFRGLTLRQSDAKRRIDRLKEQFAQSSSLMSVVEMTRLADECYELIRVHFPAQWPDIAAKAARLETRPLAG